MKNILRNKKFTLPFISILAALSLLLTAVAPAYAANIHVPIRASAVSKNTSDTELASMLHRSQMQTRDVTSFAHQVSDLQARLMALSGKKITITSSSTASERSASLRHTNLVKVLPSLTADLKRGQDLLAQTRALLATSSGFDANGIVANHAQASRTIDQLNLLLSNAQYYLERAYRAGTTYAAH